MPKTDTSLTVFISYARRDGSAFAEELVDALDVAGFAAALDRNDIAAGEDWEKRLEGLIAAADTVVFVVTPGAVASERCAWEIRTAEALSKRILPVVAIEVPAAETPAWLGRLNYIFFTGGVSFARALKQLATALATDAEWVREHTRLGELAERWERRARPEVLLLRGPELDAARHWLAEAGTGGQQPTELQRGFIDASAHYEHAQAELEATRLAAVGVEQAAKQEALQRLSRRTTLGLIASGTLAVAAGGFALWSVNAEGRFREARRQAEEAEKRSLDTAIANEASRQDITGQLIAYATSAGDIAVGRDERSMFSTAAIRALTQPDISVAAAFAQARNDISHEATRQRPLLSTSLNGEIYLGRQTPGRVLKALVVAASSRFGPDFAGVLADAEAWEEALMRCGFAVERLTNPTMGRFSAALSRFLDAGDGPALLGSPPQPIRRPGAPVSVEKRLTVEPNSLYFFAYAGECAAISGQTWLGFADTESEDEAKFRATAGNLNEITALLGERAAASIVVIDAGFTLYTGSVSLRRTP